MTFTLFFATVHYKVIIAFCLFNDTELSEKIIKNVKKKILVHL